MRMRRFRRSTRMWPRVAMLSMDCSGELLPPGPG